MARLCVAISAPRAQHRACTGLASDKVTLARLDLPHYRDAVLFQFHLMLSRHFPDVLRWPDQCRLRVEIHFHLVPRLLRFFD